MNTHTLHPAVHGHQDHTLPRASLVVTLAIAFYVALMIGTPWLLFEAPPLPEAVAATVGAAPHCPTQDPDLAACPDRSGPRTRVANVG